MLLDDHHLPPGPKQRSTRTFLKKAAVFWIVVVGAFFLIGFLGPVLGSQYGYIRTAQLLRSFNGVLFVSGVAGVPLIMVLAVGLRAFQKLLERL
ncbi:hypothetical protein [Lewinella sp. IMCC34191]|uniref:hypothetical protein n=1 Tax=Lewinella sp. IMCC34191 TaxID=2259172 RepID=UPI000E23478A|nr:hypothetical protein [Lewinella sp. IMCC34191]